MSIFWTAVQFCFFSFCGSIYNSEMALNDNKRLVFRHKAIKNMVAALLRLIHQQGLLPQCEMSILCELNSTLSLLLKRRM